MKKSIMLIASVVFMASLSWATEAPDFSGNWERFADVAQYQGASWDNLVRIESGLTIERAYEIAENDPEITFFFFTKGWNLLLDTPIGWRSFRYGDVAFFRGAPHWGEAYGLADGYVRRTSVIH